MGTAPGPAHLLEVCEQKLLEFICHVDNKDLVWLEEIEEEAVRMFTRDFNKEPELMPKTPSQKNRKKKRRISYVQDENRDPVRKRLSCKKTRSSQRLSRQLRGKDKVEKLVTAAGESPVLRRVTRATAAANPAPPTVPVAIPESTTASAQKPEPSLAPPLLVPIVQIQARERQSADEQLRQLQCAGALSPASPSLDEPSTPTKPGPGRPESVAVSALMSTPQDSKGRVPGAGRSASKLRIAQATPGLQDSPVSPWQERVLVPILPPNCTTPTGARPDSRSVRRSLMSPANQKVQVSLAEKFSLMARQELPIRRSSRLANKGPEEPAPSARIICHSYLERLLNVEVPQKVSPPHKGQEPSQEPMELAELEVPKDEASSCPRSASKIAISTPSSQAVATDPQTPPGGFPEAKADHADGAKEQPLSARRKRSYRQAVSDLDEDAELPLDDEDEEEELQPPRSKTPSPPCPASKVVRPLRTFLHTVQRNQLLMTPTSTPGSSSIVKSFIKRNTPLRVDPKLSFVEKERQRLETLRRKQEAELLRRQKVEEEKRRRLEEAKLKREERLRKALQTRKQAEQMKEEKKKQIEQKFAQLEEKNEKAKEERLAEEKARKKAAARKMEEVEARRKQEEEARRLRWLRQEEEERRRLEQQRQKEQELEQERQRKAAEARRQAEQREQERRRELERLQAEREQQEREKALQKELEEKKKKEEQQRLAEQRLQEEQERKAKEAEASRVLNMTVDVQSPSCTSYQMTPQGPRNAPKINPDNYGMDLNSDDSTDDEAHPRKPIPAWARGTQLSQAIIHQYYQSWDLLDLFGSILPLDLEDIFKKNKPRYHKRTSSAVWSSPPLQGPRAPGSLAYSLKKF